MAYSVPYGYFDEGQQAEEYKKRKAKEAEDKKKAEEERNDRRYYSLYGDRTVGAKHASNPNANNSEYEEDSKRRIKANSMYTHDVVNKGKKMKRGDTDYKPSPKYDENNLGFDFDYSTMGKKIDAANRHIRRHPDQYKEQFNIFESVEFI